MKFLAILKDSLRETLDVKLFYVMVGLSILFVLFVASVSYKPDPMETVIKPITGLTGFVLTGDLKSRKESRAVVARAEATDFTQMDPAKEPWEADHRFKLTLTLFTEKKQRNIFEDDGEEEPPVENEKGKEQVAAAKAFLTPAHVQDKLKQMLGFVNDVEVVSAAVDEPNKVAYEVTTRGTKIKSRKEWFHKPSLFFGLLDVPIPFPMTLGAIIVFIGDWIVATFGLAVIMFLSTIMTASFLPSMLTKGTVDLLLVKPVFRTTLFIYKFLGGLMFMFLNTAIIMGGIWLALGLQTGLWINTFLVCILIYTFQFAVFYAVSALSAVLTRSAIVAILVSVLLWVVMFGLGWAHWIFIERNRDRPPEEGTVSYYVYTGFDVIHAVLPHYKEVDWLTSHMIMQELIVRTRDDSPERTKAIEDLDKRYSGLHWSTSMLVSGIFVVVVVGLACLRFALKDY
jgi:ABC-type transport system involved in multi-copper enzyme maturation permease subunit